VRSNIKRDNKIARIDYTQTNTVLEALVLEASKIRHHQPFYNILAKDDKSFLYLCITNEHFPRPLLVRD
jgi:excinuclease ABC subunit C